ncbi:MAG TPA: DUF4389 domain-containing protein [Dehalococcoidia bacterium]|jgi:hypothetical protein|nr:DUF4389 domain-containing protein [Dehalococcoidia bacterium]
MSTDSSTNPHPVTYFVTPQLTDRNRLTCFFRIILAIPHIILVGGPGFAIGFGGSLGGFDGNNSAWFIGGGATGVIGAVAYVMAIISWFSIVFTGKHPKGLWDFASFFMHWRSRAIAYSGLLRDEYPPFGDGEYAVQLGLSEYPTTERNKLTVGLRLIYLIPHVIVLFFIGIAWAITAIIAWFVILFTGAYPEGLYRFAVGYMRWSLRVEAYALLMHDEYPPFSLD